MCGICGSFARYACNVTSLGQAQGVQSFISPLRNHQPPVLVPETRLSAFIAEVFSSVQTIYLAHAKLLDKLMDRQRAEWPLVGQA